MSDIVVLRGSGTSQGDDVIDPLLTTDHACMARGRVELDSQSGLHPVEMECLYRDGLLLGMTVEVYSPLLMTMQVGKISSIKHEIQGVDVATVLIVQVPSEFLV